MCGRYTIISEIQEIEAEFDVQMALPFESVFNATPSTIEKPRPLPVILSEQPKVVSLSVWGIVPYWSKEPKVKFSNINARIENLATSKLYRQLLHKQRCLVLANCYFEWMKTDKIKQPYVIYHRDRKFFAFAGLWDRWTDKSTGEVTVTYSIITCPAEDDLKHLHDRMPVIIEKDDRNRWLDMDISMKDAMDVLRRNANNRLNAYPISTAVNSPSNNNKEILQPIGKPVIPEVRHEVKQKLKLEGMGGRRKDQENKLKFWEQLGLESKESEKQDGDQGKLDL